MNQYNEKFRMEAIEGYEIFGDFEKARRLKSEFKEEWMNQKDLTYEGILTAAGWDNLENVNQSSLYTQEDEDILLEHKQGMRKFRPYLNQKVRIWGDIISTAHNGRKILVRKITRIFDGIANRSVRVGNQLDLSIDQACY